MHHTVGILPSGVFVGQQRQKQNKTKQKIAATCSFEPNNKKRSSMFTGRKDGRRKEKKSNPSLGTPTDKKHNSYDQLSSQKSMTERVNIKHQ
jgi:hypothetical protein